MALHDCCCLGSIKPDAQGSAVEEAARVGVQIWPRPLACKAFCDGVSELQHPQLCRP